jgi:hypothetical protein
MMKRRSMNLAALYADKRKAGKPAVVLLVLAGIIALTGCPVDGGDPALTGAVSITGLAMDGQTLTAAPSGDAAASPLYQWQQDTAGDDTFADITGETGSTYSVITANIGNKIKVVVTSAGYTGSVSSDPVGPVVSAAAVVKTALQSAITAAETLRDDTTEGASAAAVPYGTHYVTAAEKAAYQTAIDDAQAVVDDPIATQTEVDAAVSELAAATTTFTTARDAKTGTLATKAVLLGEINAAQAVLDAITALDPGNTTPNGTVYTTTAVKSAYQTAINAALATHGSVSEGDTTAIQAALTALAAATVTFNTGKEQTWTVSKTALQTAIDTANGITLGNYTESADGNDVLTSGKWVLTGKKAAFTGALSTANTVKNDAAATQGAVDAAASALTTATAPFTGAAYGNRALQSISVSSTIRSYGIQEPVDADDIIAAITVTGTYNTTPITAPITITTANIGSGFESGGYATAGTKTITITVDGKSSTTGITVKTVKERIAEAAGTTKTISLYADETSTDAHTITLSTADTHITLVGAGARRTINLTAGGNYGKLFIVGANSSGQWGANISLELGNNITLKGVGTNNDDSLITVYGTLTMQTGAEITGTISKQSPVLVENHGIFNMNGGDIHGNKAVRGYGGGVNVLTGGTFTMQGGTIYDNESGIVANSDNAGRAGGVHVSGTFTLDGGTIRNNRVTSITSDYTYGGAGGGVFVAPSATFTMISGTISGNDAYSWGGGVANYGTFTMQGGTISGNISGKNVLSTDTVTGGGVYMAANAAITKTGGTIYGDNGGANANKVVDYANNATVLPNRGAAIGVETPTTRVLLEKTVDASHYLTKTTGNTTYATVTGNTSGGSNWSDL